LFDSTTLLIQPAIKQEWLIWIDFRFTVDSSRNQMLYSSTWLIRSAYQLQNMKKSPSVFAIIPNQPMT
jgi:hypothetical protein